MSRTDQITFDLLRSALPAGETTPDDVQNWWQTTREHDEGFAEFLARQAILTAEAPRTVSMIAKGYLRLEGQALLAVDGIGTLNRIQAARKTEAVLVLPSPSPLLVKKKSSTKDKKNKDEIITNGRIGSKLGRCMLTRVVGEGGGGTVYEALHTGLGVPVAVKVLHEDARSANVIRALRAEARVQAHLDHPNIVRVLDFDDESPEPYLVMEFVNGHSMADMIAQCGWLRPEHAAELVAQVACGLDAAMRVGVIHRDVKPSNVLITKSGTAKIADLGLAVCSDSDLQLEVGGTGAAEAGMGGTAAYMAPERFQSKGPIQFTSDMYSLGVTFFEAVTGKLPYQGANPFELMCHHATSPIPKASDYNRQVQPVINAVISKLMAKNPADRYPNYEALLVDLADICEPGDHPFGHQTLASISDSNSTRKFGGSGFFRRAKPKE